MTNESAVDASVVNGCAANAIAFNVSVGEDKTKILRQKKVLRTSRTARNIKHNQPKNHPIPPQGSQSKTSNVKPRTSFHRSG
jgi:hypothetical protein